MLMHLIRRVTIAGMLINSLAPARVTALAVNEPGVDQSRQQPRTLGEYLAALENAHQIIILLHPAIRGGMQVTERVELAEPEAALRTLLRGYDFFLQYEGASDASVGRLYRVWVFPRGSADSVRIVRAEDLATESSRTDLSAQLHDALTRSVEEAQGLVARALEDPDENVRQQALEAILRESLPVPEHLLEGVFLGDPSDTVRAAGFDALVARAVADGIDVTSTIDRALQDPSPLVHDRALALLESLGADPPPDRRQPPAKPGGRD
jgi:hypothetical protein